MGLNCASLFLCRFFPLILSMYFFLPYDILHNNLYSLAYLIEKTTGYNIYNLQKCVNQQFMLSIRLLFNIRLLVINLGGSQK